MIEIAFKRIPNGDYYYFNQGGNTDMLIKHLQGECGHLLGSIVPKELVGKKVRVKIEIVEDD